MTAVVVAVDAPRQDDLAADLELEGAAVVACVDPRLFAADLARREPSALALLARADLLLLRVDRSTLVPSVVQACDTHGVRIVPMCPDDDAVRLAELHGLLGVALEASAHDVLHAGESRAVSPDPDAVRDRSRVIAVWGPAGSPGRSTLAVEVAVELARTGRRVCLVDADSHAPSVALALGLPDDGPGLAGACRRADLGGLDHAELARVAMPLAVGPGAIDVLVGINRPSRWPELSAARVSATLRECRGWVDDIVVDVGAALESDEEIVSDLPDGPRRNAATLAALRESDLVIAVASADPVGIARFLRTHDDLRRVVGATAVRVVVNRVRPSALGIDARGQVRRTLERFAGITAVSFLPHDPRSVDAALLGARPVSAGSPRSPLALAVRRLVAEVLAPEHSGASAATPSSHARRRRRHVASTPPRARGTRETRRTASGGE